jgi:thiosulfate/3-mercaptopyruvate sulfurtransferase
MTHRLLIEADELYRRLSDDSIHILDARFPEEYEHGHIPGAVGLSPVQLEYTEVLGNEAKVPNIAAYPEQVTEILRDAGISDDQEIVIYDGGGSYLAARLFWLLEYYGVWPLRILNGGLSAWQESVGMVTRNPSEVEGGNVVPRLHERLKAEFSDVLIAQTQRGVTLCDTLPEESFQEGAIPGSVNIPYHRTYAKRKVKRMREPAELAELYRSHGLSPDKPVVFYCGTGYSASQNYFGARLLGYEHIRLYDGSLVDWTARGGDLQPNGKAEP